MITPTTPISPAEMGRAVNDGAAVRFGLPVVVRRDDGALAALDLAAARRGVRDPYRIMRPLVDGVVELSDPLDRTVLVGEMAVDGGDIGAVDVALRLAPSVSERHDPEANERRLQAGRAALKVKNAMVRARLLDAVDGWEAIRERGTIIDESADGVLIEPDRSMRIRARILVVRCPSTARRYALLVPRDMATAREARCWTMNRSEPPEVET